MKPALPRSLPAWLFLAAAAGYSLFCIAQWSETYLDFGDGNYMYIGRRIAEGGALYREILAPQPPCHLYLGAAIVRVAEWSGMDSPLYLFRAFSLLLRLATALVTADLARAAWGCPRRGALAGAILLGLPIGAWWSMGYQSEPLELFFLVLMMRLALPGTPRGDLAAAVCGGLAALTNATAAPVLLVLVLAMAARNRRRALRLALPAALLGAGTTALMEAVTGGHFLENVVFNQAGSYPRDGFLAYALRKLLNEGNDVLFLEGFFILAALAALPRFWRTTPLGPEARSGVAWFALAAMGSIFYVTKGGTMDYVFSLAEPGIALLAADSAFRLAASARRMRAASPREALAAMSAGGALLALFSLGPVAAHYTRIWNGLAWELPAYNPKWTGADGRPVPNVEQVKLWIERHSSPGDAILAPPHYAFITERRIWGDYCEIFLWTMKDRNDRAAGLPEGAGWAKTKALAASLRKREIPIALIEMDQTGRLPEIRAALEAAYRPLIPEPYPTLNTRLGVYVPKE